MRTVRWLGAGLAGFGLLAILVLTLVPNPRQTPMSDHTPLLCLVCGESGMADVVLNLLLFMPLAAGLALLGWRWTRVLAACAILSLGVETAQYFLVTGRDASLSDILTNTAGGALAAALARRLGLLLAPGPALAGRLAPAGAAAWLGLLAFTAAALQPWAPAGPLRNYCSAAYPTAEVFGGTARRMALDGVPLSCEREVGNAAALARQLRRGRFTLETVAESVEPERRKVVHVVRSPHASLVVLAQHARAAVFQAPVAAQAVRLFAPSVRLPRAFPRRAGAPVSLVGESLEGRRLRLTSVHEGEHRSVALALSPSYGWTLLFGGGLVPGRGLSLAAALWLAALILPAAYWAGLAARPARAFGSLAVAAIAGLGVLPALTGFEPVHWSEWAGAGAGIALGWALSRIAAYLQSRCGSPSTSAYSSS